MTDQTHDEETKPRWWLISLLAAIGVLLIIAGAAFATTSEKDYVGSILVNLGTTLLLAGILVLLERRFTKSVTTSIQNTDRAVAQAIDRATTETAAVFEGRLADMDARIARLREASQGEAEAAVAAISDNPTFEVISDAFRKAVEIRAIQAGPTFLQSGQVIVASGDSPDSSRISIQWHDAHDYDGVRQHDAGIAFGYVPSGTIDVHALTSWDPEMDPAKAILEFQTRMTAEAFGREAREISAETLIKHLRTVLLESYLGRSAAPNSSLNTNTVLEWLWNGWAITEVGLEIPGDKLLAADGSKYPAHRGRSYDYSPPRPPDVADSDWLKALEQLRAHFLWRDDRPVTF